MNRWLKIWILSTLLAVVPSVAEGQPADTVFVGTQHSPWTGGLLEFAFPTAGFAYAGDWSRLREPRGLVFEPSPAGGVSLGFRVRH